MFLFFFSFLFFFFHLFGNKLPRELDPWKKNAITPRRRACIIYTTLSTSKLTTTSHTNYYYYQRHQPLSPEKRKEDGKMDGKTVPILTDRFFGSFGRTKKNGLPKRRRGSMEGSSQREPLRHITPGGGRLLPAPPRPYLNIGDSVT